VGARNEAFQQEEEIKRRKALTHLLGIGEAEASDTSLQGRLSIIAKLKAARRAEIARGQTGSWLYDVNRHLNICAFLRREYDALEETLAGDEAHVSAPPRNAVHPARNKESRFPRAGRMSS